MNNGPTLGDVAIIVFLIFIVGFGTFMVGYTQGKHRVYLDAVNHNAAYWVAESDGTTHIEWGKKNE